MSFAVTSASPDPTFTRNDTLSEIGKDKNVAFGTGPDPTGILGADASGAAAGRTTARAPAARWYLGAFRGGDQVVLARGTGRAADDNADAGGTGARRPMPSATAGTNAKPNGRRV
jgi:hypothetical protein